MWYLSFLYLVGLVRRNNSVADVGWAPGFVLVVLAALWMVHPYGLRPVIVATLVTIWGLRLGLHIFMRNWARGEDWRYARWRRYWQSWWPLVSYVLLFVLPGAAILVITAPVLWVIAYGGPVALNGGDMLGIALWVGGFVMEAAADAQLVRFLKRPINKGRILRTGLWRYSRHPNYFGELLQWWGLWLVALSVPGAFNTIAGPVLLTILILWVSGVPTVEHRWASSPTYKLYAKRTNALVPMAPRASK